MGSDAIIEGCGKRLAEARAAKSLSVLEVAGQLKFSSSQIEAMEAEDWGRFPSRATLRGFLRAYAQHLNLDPASLFVATESQVAVADPLTPTTTGIHLSASRARIWLVVIPVVAVVFFALVMGLYTWLSQGADEPLRTESLPEAVPAVTRPETPAAPSTPVVPVVPPTVPAAPAAPSAELQSSLPAAAATTDVTTNGSELVFTTTVDAWIEVTDVTNQRVSRLIRGGERMRIVGKPPYKLVVGNAAHVSLQYNNRSIDLKPFIGEKVARLTLE